MSIFILIILFILILIVTVSISLLTVIDLLVYLSDYKRLLSTDLNRLISILVMVIYPLGYLLLNGGNFSNDCCSHIEPFTSKHRIALYYCVGSVIITSLISSFRSKSFSPMAEIILNVILIFGIVLNTLIAIQINSSIWIFGNLPIGALLVLNVLENYRRVVNRTNENMSVESSLFRETSK